jgi:hypothetical protein
MKLNDVLAAMVILVDAAFTSLHDLYAVNLLEEAWENIPMRPKLIISSGWRYMGF